MAKIQFGDYLKSKKKKGNIYESGEALVARAKGKLEVDGIVVSPAYRVQNLEEAARLLGAAEDCPGAARLKAEAEDRLRDAKEKKKEADYERACLHLSEAKEEYEYGKAAAEFEKIPGYKDADKKGAEARKTEKSLNRRFQIRRLVILALLAALALLIWQSYKAGLLNYGAARLEGLGGKYESAYSRMSKIDVLDSQERAEKYYQLYLRQREASEEKALPEAETGDTVSFGGEKWLVLDRAGRRLVMICSSPGEKSAFRYVRFNDEAGEVTWADSTLRKYLNGRALSVFTDLEISSLVDMTYTPSGNDHYGVFSSSGELTDKVRIFDAEDLSTYKDVFEKPGVDMWLSTPGHDLESAAYLTRDGVVMYYGDDVADDSLSACPVVTVDLKALAAEESEAAQ